MRKVIRSTLVIAAMVCTAVQFSSSVKAAESATPASNQRSSKADDKEGKAHGVTYPDIWFRSFEGPEDVVDMFFSDEAIWHNEPVLILKNPRTNRGEAVGFFSGKRLAIHTVYNEKKWTGCRDVLNFHHFYAGTKQELVRRYIPSQDSCSGKIKMEDGANLEHARDAILECSWIDSPLNGLLPKNFTKRGQQGEGCECEPISEHLVKVDESNNVVWAKAFVRFYSDRAVAPSQNNDHCLSEKLRLQSESDIVLALSDGTLLVLGPNNAVLRIRSQDGSTSFSSATLKVLESSDVIRTKLDLVEKDEAELKKCGDLGAMTKAALMACLDQLAEKKCHEFSKYAEPSHSDCDVYGSQSVNAEQQQVELAKRLFEK